MGLLLRVAPRARPRASRSAGGGGGRRDMRPLLLSSHSRPITQVKYNREGDILITTAKDHYPGVWYSDDGRRIGTLEHNGTVWSCDINQASTRIVTASADCKVKIWDLDKEPGKVIFTFECFNTPCRYIEYACGDKQALLTTDPFMQQSSAIHIHHFDPDYFNTDSWFGTTKLRKMYEDKYGERADWHKGEKAAA